MVEAAPVNLLGDADVVLFEAADADVALLEAADADVALLEAADADVALPEAADADVALFEPADAGVVLPGNAVRVLVRLAGLAGLAVVAALMAAMALTATAVDIARLEVVVHKTPSIIVVTIVTPSTCGVTFGPELVVLIEK